MLKLCYFGGNGLLVFTTIVQCFIGCCRARLLNSLDPVGQMGGMGLFLVQLWPTKPLPAPSIFWSGTCSSLGPVLYKVQILEQPEIGAMCDVVWLGVCGVDLRPFGRNAMLHAMPVLAGLHHALPTLWTVPHVVCTPGQTWSSGASAACSTVLELPGGGCVQCVSWSEGYAWHSMPTKEGTACSLAPILAAPGSALHAPAWTAHRPWPCSQDWASTCHAPCRLVQKQRQHWGLDSRAPLTICLTPLL